MTVTVTCPTCGRPASATVQPTADISTPVLLSLLEGEAQRLLTTCPCTQTVTTPGG